MATCTSYGRGRTVRRGAIELLNFDGNPRCIIVPLSGSITYISFPADVGSKWETYITNTSHANGRSSSTWSCRNRQDITLERVSAVFRYETAVWWSRRSWNENKDVHDYRSLSANANPQCLFALARPEKPCTVVTIPSDDTRSGLNQTNKYAQVVTHVSTGVVVATPSEIVKGTAGRF